MFPCLIGRPQAQLTEAGQPICRHCRTGSSASDQEACRSIEIFHNPRGVVGGGCQPDHGTYSDCRG